MKNLLLITIVLFVFAMLIALTSCTFTPRKGANPKVAPYTPDPNLIAVPIAHATNAVSAAEAHVDSASKLIDAAKPISGPIAEPLLTRAMGETSSTLTELGNIRSQLNFALTDKVTAEETAKKAVAQRDDAIAQVESDRDRIQDEWTKKYADLEHKWYVVAGRWIEWAAFWLITAWVSLGILSIFFGMGNPIGALPAIGKEIVHLIPFGNVFPWIHSGINALTGKK